MNTLIEHMLKKSYTHVHLDLSEGSSYHYRHDSHIPMIIYYGRKHAGKYQSGHIKGLFTNDIMHDIVYMIKRGYELHDIEERFNIEIL